MYLFSWKFGTITNTFDYDACACYTVIRLGVRRGMLGFAYLYPSFTLLACSSLKHILNWQLFIKKYYDILRLHDLLIKEISWALFIKNIMVFSGYMTNSNMKSSGQLFIKKILWYSQVTWPTHLWNQLGNYL